MMQFLDQKTWASGRHITGVGGAEKFLVCGTLGFRKPRFNALVSLYHKIDIRSLTISFIYLYYLFYSE